MDLLSRATSTACNTGVTLLHPLGVLLPWLRRWDECAIRASEAWRALMSRAGIGSCTVGNWISGVSSTRPETDTFYTKIHLRRPICHLPSWKSIKLEKAIMEAYVNLDFFHHIWPLDHGELIIMFVLFQKSLVCDTMSPIDGVKIKLVTDSPPPEGEETPSRTYIARELRSATCDNNLSRKSDSSIAAVQMARKSNSATAAIQTVKTRPFNSPSSHGASQTIIHVTVSTPVNDGSTVVQPEILSTAVQSKLPTPSSPPADSSSQAVVVLPLSASMESQDMPGLPSLENSHGFC